MHNLWNQKIQKRISKSQKRSMFYQCYLKTIKVAMLLIIVKEKLNYDMREQLVLYHFFFAFFFCDVFFVAFFVTS